MPVLQTINQLDSWLTDLEESEGFTGSKADTLSKVREQVGTITPKQKQKLLDLSDEQWQTLSSLELDNVEALDNWLSSALN